MRSQGGRSALAERCPIAPANRRKSHQRHEHDTGATTANECHQRPPNQDHRLPLLAASQLVAELQCVSCTAHGGLAVLAFLVTKLGKVAAAVVISRSFFGEDRVGVVGSRHSLVEKRRLVEALAGKAAGRAARSRRAQGWSTCPQERSWAGVPLTAKARGG
jgi:hypothetical protein